MMGPDYAPPDPPKHLHSTGAHFWSEFCCEWELESEDDLELLRLGCEALDRAAQARRLLRDNGLTWIDRLGNLRERPEVRIELRSRTSAAAIVKQLQASQIAAQRLELAAEREQRMAAQSDPKRRDRRGGGVRLVA